MESIDPFEQYQSRVKALYNKAGSVFWSIAFDAAPPELCTPPELARSILEAVPAEAWLHVYKAVNSNWAWRPEHEDNRDREARPDP